MEILLRSTRTSQVNKETSRTPMTAAATFAAFKDLDRKKLEIM
jgi:hypothetical protein